MIHGEKALCSDGGILPTDSRKQHDRNAMEASSSDPSAGDLVNNVHGPSPTCVERLVLAECCDQKRCLILISQDGPLKMQYGRRCGWLVSAKRKCGNQQGQSAQLSVVARVSSYRVLIIVECNKFQKTQTLWFVRWTTEGARSFYTYWLADSLTDGSVRLLKRIPKKKDDLSAIVYTRPRIYN